MSAIPALKASTFYKPMLETPIEIVLVCFGSEVSPNLVRRLEKNLNKTADIFHYRLIQDPIAWHGQYDADHCYSNGYYFKDLKAEQTRAPAKYVIGFTHESLEGSKFNVHDHEVGVGMITVDDYGKFKPASMSLEQYLAYLVLCESFCLAGVSHLEHGERRYDLFDECYKKEDLRECLTNPKISVGSRDKLRQLGFPPAAGDKILAYVGKTQLFEVVHSAFSNPALSFVVGILLGLAQVLLPGQTPIYIRLAVGVALAVLVGAFILWSWLRSKPGRSSS